MCDESLNEKMDYIDYIVEKVENIESLIARRLTEDKSKNILINDLTAYLSYRQDLDRGVAFSKIMLDILRVTDRLQSGIPSKNFNLSVSEELIEIMTRYGLSTIGERKNVDPRVHEVVEVVEKEELEDGIIVSVVQQGYTLDKKVLRPSKVIINRKSTDIVLESIE